MKIWKSRRLDDEGVRMGRDWDERARENRVFSEDSSGLQPGSEEFWESGRAHVREHILDDLGNVARNRDPKTMKVLEIGCGSGRVTRALAEVFGEVHAVDVSGEMIARARRELSDLPNVRLYQNKGWDLSFLEEESFDFAFSILTFKHIPALPVIERYFPETARVLKTGALFKVELMGDLRVRNPNTWVGAPVGPEEAARMAQGSGFDLRFSHGAGDPEFWLWLFRYPTREASLEAMSTLMEEDWDRRAKENAEYYINTASESWSSKEFYETGRETVRIFVLNDMENICQGKDPKQMKVLEIGCGAGRITRALAEVFGEVHAVDVSAEMVEKAKRALADVPNAHVYKNNGRDLRVIPARGFDFAFSYVVFQHIPSKGVIENYVREVHRLLRYGALFKFQVQGSPGVDLWDTWVGVSLTRPEAIAMGERNGFEVRYVEGENTQEFWLWYFRRGWKFRARIFRQRAVRRLRRFLP